MNPTKSKAQKLIVQTFCTDQEFFRTDQETFRITALANQVTLLCVTVTKKLNF